MPGHPDGRRNVRSSHTCGGAQSVLCGGRCAYGSTAQTLGNGRAFLLGGDRNPGCPGRFHVSFGPGNPVVLCDCRCGPACWRALCTLKQNGDTVRPPGTGQYRYREPDGAGGKTGRAGADYGAVGSIALWGGPSGLRGSPWTRSSADQNTTPERPARGPAADQGVCPTNEQRQM